MILTFWDLFSYVWGLVIPTFGGYFSYVYRLVFLRLMG